MLHLPTTGLCRKSLGILTVFSTVCVFAALAYAQDNTQTRERAAAKPSPEAAQTQPIRTDSPRETLASFLRLTREFEDAVLAYKETQNRANRDRIFQVGPQYRQLIDLSAIPAGARRDAGVDALIFLLDTIGRIDLPPLEEVPDAAAYDDDETPARWRIPGTPITIVRIEEGPRAGEFLFGSRTVEIVPAFHQRIQHLPLRSSLGIDSWRQLIPQLHGPLIPVGLVSVLPDVLEQTWLDTPIWKILTVVIVSAAAALLLVLWHRVTNLGTPKNRITAGFRRVLTPAAIILAVLSLRHFFDFEVNVAGTFSRIVNFAEILVIIVAAVWAFWIVVVTLFEWIILSPKIPDDSLDANLLRLSARVIGFIGAVVILAFGAQDLGLPVLSLIAGLGIGGLAVALAIRPTLENLIGGVILYADRPVRVGDYCSFGTRSGFVENIGVRSTQIRALDRTLISIPNAAFADMEIVNWAKCDRMLVLTTIGLRYETEPDQLRYVLARLREMFLAHPKIDHDTVRVRFAGYGDSSLNIEIRVYALTREFNEFYAIREDTFLRVNEIINESGTGFAFPSRTVYMGQDEGLDKARSDAAVEQVQTWRRNRRLPFPRMSPRRAEELASTLDYPPRGSPDTEVSLDQATEETPEPLSAEPLSNEPLSAETEHKEDEKEEEKTGPNRR